MDINNEGYPDYDNYLDFKPHEKSELTLVIVMRVFNYRKSNLQSNITYMYRKVWKNIHFHMQWRLKKYGILSNWDSYHKQPLPFILRKG